ncbi:MAG: hypothetical protein UX04_C0002G0080 [Microgenomates group bacterium GW2011_GWF2_45_18]|nr:MAG: hypothetical protein UW18_C0001G0017 [Microgenomates group bacterium GW2011_GWF1_44_10]KKU01937.1 MAG: hypothetical protein UX04_C0002G0080 [Microgenomates group bacterium GW2011_GWF2_45_18]OGJ41463.1 MAG: hypothetical protein A2378_00040 [Candidatus Pacebacteria bacterium RIFOXYB1_FULL_44_10]HAU98749.1 hypothetical protein [Candidatus Paceibacterota bacterium]HAX01431.1 hypothetical protein [Candidatus Paceibacterota bacterium]
MKRYENENYVPPQLLLIIGKSVVGTGIYVSPTFKLKDITPEIQKRIDLVVSEISTREGKSISYVLDISMPSYIDETLII